MNHFCVVTPAGQADAATVTVPTDVHDDPEPAAGRADPGRGHDEEKLLRVPQSERCHEIQGQGRHTGKADQ